MPRLTRTQKFADLRESLANDSEKSLQTNELSKFEDRLNNLEGFSNNNIEVKPNVFEEEVLDDNAGTPLIYDDPVVEEFQEESTNEEPVVEDKADDVLASLFGDINSEYEELLQSSLNAKKETNEEIISEIFNEPEQPKVVEEVTIDDILSNVNKEGLFDSIPELEKQEEKVVRFDDIALAPNEPTVAEELVFEIPVEEDDYVDQPTVEEVIEEPVVEEEAIEQPQEIVEEPVVEEVVEQPIIIEESRAEEISPELFEEYTNNEVVEPIIEEEVVETVEPETIEEEVELVEQPQEEEIVEIEEVQEDIAEFEDNQEIPEVVETIDKKDDFNQFTNSIIDEIRHSSNSEAEFEEAPVESDDEEFSNTVSMEISKIISDLAVADANNALQDTKVLESASKIIEEVEDDGIEIKNLNDTIAGTMSNTIPFIVENRELDPDEEEQEGSNVVLNIILIVLIIVLIAVLGLIVYYILKTKGIL